MIRVSIEAKDINCYFREKTLLTKYDKANGLNMIPQIQQIVAEELNNNDEFFKVIEELCNDYECDYKKVIINITLKIVKVFNPELNYDPNTANESVFDNNPNIKSLAECIYRLIERTMIKIRNNYLREYIRAKYPELTDTSGVKNLRQADFIMAQYQAYLDAATQDITPTPPAMDSEGRLILRQGDLFHGRSSKESTLRTIASRGIESGQLHGIAEDGETFMCTDFFKVKKEVATPDEVCTFGAQYTGTPNRIVFVINRDDAFGETAIFPQLTMYNAYDETTEQGKTARAFVNAKALPLSADTGASFLIGIPASLISAIIVQGEFEQNEEKLNLLNELFPKAHIFSRTTGKLLRGPLEQKKL